MSVRFGPGFNFTMRIDHHYYPVGTVMSSPSFREDNIMASVYQVYVQDKLKHTVYNYHSACQWVSGYLSRCGFDAASIKSSLNKLHEGMTEYRTPPTEYMDATGNYPPENLAA